MWNILRQLFAPRIQQGLIIANIAKFQSPLFSTPHLSTFSSSTVGHPNPLLAVSSPVSSTWSRCNLSPSPSPMFGGLIIVPTRGMKVKGRVKRRCKDCYFIYIDGVLHNKCKTHPRHTQKQQEKYWANVRILTHATMSPKRPW